MGRLSRKHLSANLDLLMKMKGLAKKQAELVENDEMGEFLNLAAERADLQREISMNKRKSNGLGVGRQIADQLLDVIRSIQDVDKHIARIIQLKKVDLLLEIKDMRHRQTALKGYGGKKSTDPRFIDRKG